MSPRKPTPPASPKWSAAIPSSAKPADPAWAEPMRVSAEREMAEAPPTTREPDPAGPIDLATVEQEAAALAPGPFGFLLWVNARRIAFGMPAFSPWWLWAIDGFYDSGKPLGVFDVGRGGGKSSTLEGVAATDSLFVPRRVPPGQTWTWPFISVGPDDANRRINGIAAVYRAIGMPVIGDDDGEGRRLKEGVKITRAPRAAIDLVDARGNPIALASIAGTVGNVSGPSTIGMTIDEAAKLRDRVTNANPLTEILASVTQTSRGRPGWRGIVCSSAWDTSGAFWALVKQGDTATNYVARIGAPFIDAALAGFESVAVWEETNGSHDAARIIRDHMRTLTAESPMVPTWVANPTLGHPDAKPWTGAALATRKLVESLPETALGGVPRVRFWLRECGSLPLDRGESGAGSEEACLAAAEMTHAIMDRRQGVERPKHRAVAAHPMAGPGDARFAGPSPRTVERPTTWRERKVM